MTGEVQAAGDLVAGGLIAHAVERPGGTGVGDHEGACRNCGASLVGAYCHVCGQPAHLHRSLAAIWHDLAHGVLHFEGKIWRTLPLLAWRPGELTRRYIHGERARFVSPMALFLFSVFLMFAVIQAMGVHLEASRIETRVQATAELDRELASHEAAIARLDSERAVAVAAGKSTAATDSRRRELKAEMTSLRTGQAALGLAELTNVKTGWAALDHGLEKANANPNLALYKVQMSAYKFSWALIPISVPFVWLMFAWRPRYKVYDHAIFVIYSLSFMTLLGVALTVGGGLGLGGAVIATAAVFIPPIHMYRQLRGAYQLGRFNALLRTTALGIFASVAATFFIILLLALGVMG